MNETLLHINNDCSLIYSGETTAGAFNRLSAIHNIYISDYMLLSFSIGELEARFV